MSRPLLIIVTGLPCTGKTTLGRHIARELGLPFIHKDGIKETLFNSLGWRDRAWSRQLGGATYHLLYYLLEVLMQAGTSLVIESNFDPQRDSTTLAGLVKRHDYTASQVLCKTEGARLLERFRARSDSNDRHPGHVDAFNYAEMEPQLLKGRLAPLPLPGLLVEVDTTDFDMVDYVAVLQALQDESRSQI